MIANMRVTMTKITMVIIITMIITITMTIIITRLLPAANMGEYEPPRERPEDGGLYPLNAEVANTIIMTMMMVMVVMVIMISQTISREPMVECQKTGTLAGRQSFKITVFRFGIRESKTSQELGM